MGQPVVQLQPQEQQTKVAVVAAATYRQPAVQLVALAE
jgi:hypothetical protein